MADWDLRLTLAGSCSAVLSALLAWTWQNWSSGNCVIAGILGLLLLVNVAMTLMIFHAASLHPAASHTLKSLSFSYVLNHIIIPYFGKYSAYKFVKMTKNPQKYQDELLMNIIRANCQTDFGKDYKLEMIKNRAEFVKQFPLTTFTHFEKYVERVANGEQYVMTKAKVIHLSVSSGTTGKNKMYPLTNANLKQVMHIVMVTATLMNKLSAKKLDRILGFRLSNPLRQSKGGIKIAGISAARPSKVPDDVIPSLNSKIYQEEPSYFVQAVFGLREREIDQYQGFSSDLTYAFFNSFEYNKHELHKAIATGHIKAMTGLDEDIRQGLNQLLTPDPERADEVLREIEKGPERLALRLWPKLKFGMVCRGGGFAHTASILEKTYLKDVKFCFVVHVGSEGFYGSSTSTEDGFNEIFTFLPSLTFFEFIKVEDMEKPDPKTYLLEEIEVGLLYELVVTNFYGLYRNRFGDVIKVVGYTNNTPKYVFEYRTGQILNCGLDRTPEKALYDAIAETENQWKLPIKSYTTVENVHLDSVTGNKSPRNHYVVFVELQGDEILTQEHQQMLEANLQIRQESYAEFRGINSLDPIKIIQIGHGTFDGLRSVLLGGQTNQQFKLPRVLRKHEALQYLWENRVTK